MNTLFGKFIGQHIFSKVFLIFIFVSVLWGAFINGHAVGLLLNNFGLSSVIGLIYIIMGLLSVMQEKLTKKWISKKFERIIGFISCFFIYDFMVLLFWWILAKILPTSEKVDAIGVFCSDVFAAITVLIGYFHAKRIKCRSYSIKVGLKGSAYRIVLLSDIHLGVFVREKQIQHVVAEINKLKADLVVICGDIIDSNNHILKDDEALDKISMEFQKIYTKEGVFAVLGNHDPKADNEKFKSFLRSSNIQLLHNQTVQLSKINLIGRTNAYNNYRRPMKELSNKIDKAMPTVVLDHDPCNIPESVEFGVDLVLCGHTHKGQFFPITYFTKLANGKHYFYGYERFGNTHAVISSGVGFFQLPVRIGTSSEIVDIQLT